MNKSTLLLLLFLLNSTFVYNQETNTGIYGLYGGDITQISTEFGQNNWANQESNYRLSCDVDGDGRDDIVGFSSTGVQVAFSNGSTLDNSVTLSTDFITGYTGYDQNPRYCQDVDGDGLDDIVGIKDDGVYVAYSTGRTNFETAVRLTAYYGADSTFRSINSYPRVIQDIDGDGMADIVAFGRRYILISYSQGKDGSGNPQDFTTSVINQEIFCTLVASGGYNSYNTYPRFVGNFYTNNTAAILGIGTDNIYKSPYVDRTTHFYQEAVASQSTNNEYYRTFYPNQETSPRLIGDINGDGLDDIIGFHPDQIEFSTMNDGILNPSQKYSIPGNFVRDGGFSSFNEHPRILADINNDGQKDVIAFGTDGTYVMLTQMGCIHSSRDSSQSCKCKDGFREDPLIPNGACLPCGYPCKRCENSDTNCLECLNYNSDIVFRHPVNNCNCIDGYYRNFSDECVKCNDECVLCVTTGDNCTQCRSESLSLRKTTPSDCMCIDSYYQNSSFQCLKCKNKFARCSAEDTAIECQGLNRENEGLNCICQTKHFEIIANNQTDCTRCNDECAECSNSPSQCTSCIPGPNRKPTPSDCTCLDLTFYENSSNQCVKCKNKFATCSAENTAISCQGLNRENESLNCACLSKYFEIEADNQRDCTRCNDECSECENSPSQCTSCIPGANRKPAPSDCTCQDSYYENSSIQCVKCKNKYAKCSGLNTVIECQGLNRENEAQNCVCQTKHFEIIANDERDCTRCNDECAECENSPSQCTSCIPGANRKPVPSDCTCLDSFYENSSNQCVKCKNKYAKCSDETTVIECQGLNRENEGLDCVCQTKHFEIIADNQTDCIRCNEQCGECENSPSECTSCIAGANRKPVPSDCTCLDSFYENSSNECVKCKNKYAKCSDENTAIECQGLNRENEGFDCVCKVGFFEVIADDQLNCGRCSNLCRTCDELGCTECSDNDPNRDPRTCECQIGFYADGPTCKKCNRNCSSCNNNFTCTEQCHSSCALCDSTTNCISCPVNTYLNSDKHCASCHPKCYSCQNFSTCISCSLEKGVGRSQNGDCSCEEGFYENGNNLDCLQCPLGCKSCDNTGQCLVCQNPNLIPPLCKQSKQGIILNEFGSNPNSNNDGHCDPKCSLCEDTPSNCTQCTLGQFRQSQLPCNCIQGYHDNDSTTPDCQKCPNLCKKCLSDAECFECELKENVVLNHITMKCECEKGFQLDNEGRCSKCYTYHQQCFLTCPKNTIQNEELYVCYDIHFHLQSQSSYILIGGICLLFILFATIPVIYCIQKTSKPDIFMRLKK